jgi:hypothetical protein
MSKMNRDERLYKIYLKWFKFGFERMMHNLRNPDLWLHVNEAFNIDYKYDITFVESLPWNNRWVYLGYRDGYDFVDPFDYGNKMPDDFYIRYFFNSRRYKN